MEKKQEIIGELKTISPFMAEIEVTNPFSVPEGYFQGLPAAINEKIHLSEIGLLGSNRKNSFQVPKGYFEGLSATILSSIEQAGNRLNEITTELEDIAPVLNTIPRSNVYSVPSGYFLEPMLPATVKKLSVGAKIVPLKMVQKWMQYAAAALVTGILVTAAFLFTDDKTYLEYEKLNQLDVPTELNKVSDEELVKYLTGPEQVQNSIPDASFMEGQEVADIENTTIQLVSDEELDHYLSEIGETAKVVVKKNK